MIKVQGLVMTVHDDEIGARGPGRECHEFCVRDEYRARFSGRRWGPGAFRYRRSAGRVPARRPASFLASPRKEAKKRPLLHRSSASRLTPLRCSHRAAGAELARCAGSDSCAGRPRPLLRCSAAQRGLSGITERCRGCGCDRRKGDRRQATGDRRRAGDGRWKMGRSG